jgi:hypothetical protein
MKLYTCSHCHNLLYFENNVCLNCDHMVGFDAAALALITLDGKNGNEYYNIANKKDIYRFCENAVHGTCNWLVPASQAFPFCQACELNRTIPSLTENDNLKRWKLIEVAKHRLVYSLLRLHLPVEAKKDNEETGIAFDFMADGSSKEKIMTGHDNGTITLNIEEADEAERVRHKLDLGEKYRTLLGHFRHEIGHYYWEVIIKNSSSIKKFRQLFGDEQKDYAKALETYYKNGVPANWADHFISPYATSHAWEDWAESWAHYLHMMDTLETAYAFGIRINPKKAADEQDLQINITSDPYSIANFDEIIKMWLPLTFAVNSLNRSMGHPDFYPFIISSPVIEKLKFIHEEIRKATTKK